MTQVWHVYMISSLIIVEHLQNEFFLMFFLSYLTQCAPYTLDISTHRKPVHYTTKSKNKAHDANSKFDEQRRNDLNGYICRL